MQSAHLQFGEPILQVLPCETDADLAPTAIELASKYDNLFKEIVTAGWATKSDGNTEAPSGYFSYINIEQSDVEDFRDMLSHHDGAENLIVLFHELEYGWYLTREDSNGLIWVWYDSEANVKDAYRFLENEYTAWEEQVEDELL